MFQSIFWVPNGSYHPQNGKNGKIEKFYPSGGTYDVIIDENSISGLSEILKSIHPSIASVIVIQSTLNLQLNCISYTQVQFNPLNVFTPNKGSYKSQRLGSNIFSPRSMPCITSNKSFDQVNLEKNDTCPPKTDKTT